MKKNLKMVMFQISMKTCIRFKPYENEADYLQFQRSSICRYSEWFTDCLCKVPYLLFKSDFLMDGFCNKPSQIAITVS